MKTIKNRKRKFAFSMKIIAALSCLAIASVGFASWLVVHEPESTNTAGDVNVALTSAAELVFEKPTPTLGDVGNGNVEVSSFSFGRPAEKGAVDIKWLVPQEVETEDMIEVYTLTFKPQNLPTGTIAKITLDFDAVHATTDGSTTNYQDINTRLAKLISQKYLTLSIQIDGQTPVVYDEENPLPTTGAVVKYDVSWDDLLAAQTGNESISVNFTIQFAWGDAFGNKNPYVYYNTMEDPTAQDKVDALNVLAEIAALVKGTQLFDEDGDPVAGADYRIDGADAPLSYLVVIDAELDLNNVQYPGESA